MHLQKAIIIQCVHFTESILKRNASVGSMEVKNADLRTRELLKGSLERLTELLWMVVPRIDGEDPVSGQIDVDVEYKRKITTNFVSIVQSFRSSWARYYRMRAGQNSTKPAFVS